MKIIDEKGKFWGIINIIDLAILLVLILGISAAGYKFIGNRAAGSQASTKEVIVSVLCSAKPETAVKALQKGDRLVAGTNYVNGFVDSVSYKDAQITVTTADGRLVTATDPTKKDIYVTLRMNIDANSPVLKLGTQEVRVGAYHYVKTQKAEILGIVNGIEIK